MTLPSNFQFSQGSLQDFRDCPRRFQLKYLEHLVWPAIESEPALENEKHLQLGADFHHLLQQFFLRVSIQDLNTIAEKDGNLLSWWENFHKSRNDILRGLSAPGTHLFPEISLSVPLDNFRLIGKFDLLAISGEDFFIFDWKTSRSHPKREHFKNNLQTRVYPYLLVRSGLGTNINKPIKPSHVKMIYWFANFPTIKLNFNYSEQQYTEDSEYIMTLIDGIRRLDESPARKTRKDVLCNFCVYRSLCNRGTEAGLIDKKDDDDYPGEIDIIDINFEQISEIEY